MRNGYSMPPGMTGQRTRSSLTSTTGKAAERRHSRSLSMGALEQCGLVLSKTIRFPDLKGGPETDKGRAFGDVCVQCKLFG